MKIEIPVIVRPLSLLDYAPEIDVTMQVWVNPPRALLMEYYDILNTISSVIKQEQDADAADNAGFALMGWLAKVWSAGAEDTRWTAEDVAALWERCKDTDPALWAWVTSRTAEMIFEHRANAKKK